MPNKQFSIYSGDLIDSAQPEMQLFVEAGDQHIAFVIKNSVQNSIVALEIFTFPNHEAEKFENVLEFIKADSKLLAKSYSSAVLTINNELAILIPSFKFNKDISDDYLHIAFGDDKGYVKNFDAVNTDPVIMNAFRVKIDWMHLLSNLALFTTVKHIYTSVIEDAYKKTNDSENLVIQFYNHHIIVCAMQQQKLLLVQTFAYETPEDVLYHLLNLKHQLNLTGADLVLHVSGMIDLKSNLYEELEKYFQNVSIDTLPNALFAGSDQQFPPHYFTPFCKLAL